MACGGVKSSETGKISCEAYQSKMKINVNLLNFAFCSAFILQNNLKYFKIILGDVRWIKKEL